MIEYPQRHERRERSFFSYQLKGSLIALLISVIAVGGVVYQISNKSLTEHVKNALLYHAEFREARILNLFAQQKAWMQEIASSAGIQLAAEELFDLYRVGEESRRYQLASGAFREDYRLLLSTQGVDDLFLVTTEGELVFSLRPMDEEIGIDLTAAGFYGVTILSGLIEKVQKEQELVISKYGKIEQVEESTVLMGIPLFSNFPGQEGEMVGIMVRPFSLKRLRSLLESYSGLGKTGEVMVAQRRGGPGSEVNFINHFREYEAREPDAECRRLRMEQPERFPVIHALAGGSGEGWMLDQGCVPIYAVWTWLPELQLAVVVKQDREEILKPVANLQRDMAVAALVALLFLVWIVHRQTRTLVQPIEQLRAATEEGTLNRLEPSPIGEVNELAEALQERTNRLECAIQETDRILESMDEGLVVLDERERVLRVNSKLAQMVGVAPDSLIGRSVESLFGMQVDLIEEERMLRCEDGSTIPVSLSRAMLDEMEGVEQASVVVLHDLREILNAERAMRANKAKDDFLALMSHELRTPLTTIIGNSQMLVGDGLAKLNRRQQTMVRAIEIAGRTQLALVNDILDLSKMEAGKFEVDEDDFDLYALIDELNHIFTSRAQDAQLDFVIHNELQLGHYLIGDKRRIGQVLTNLLGNALKFTESGAVTLSITRDGSGEWICFTVEDEGIGMAPDTIQRLFEPFEQADRSISRRFGGSGLGLHISSTLVELMGGRIEVESEPEKGSRFHFMLPFRLSEQVLVPEEEAQEEEFYCRFSGRILVAEDTPELQLVERNMLEAMGLQVTIASNGREAVRLAMGECGAFGLILMDMRMPVMDGIEATQELRKLGYQGTIIAHTADMMTHHQKQFLEIGCDDLLAKPIDQKALRRILRAHFPREEEDVVELSREKPKRDSDVSSYAPPAVTAAAHFEISDELRQIFISRIGELREELMTVDREQDHEQLYHIAHTIKGSGSVYGYPELSHLGEQVCNVINNKQWSALGRQVDRLIMGIEGALRS